MGNKVKVKFGVFYNDQYNGESDFTFYEQEREREREWKLYVEARNSFPCIFTKGREVKEKMKGGNKMQDRTNYEIVFYSYTGLALWSEKGFEVGKGYSNAHSF